MPPSCRLVGWATLAAGDAVVTAGVAGEELVTGVAGCASWAGCWAFTAFGSSVDSVLVHADSSATTAAVQPSLAMLCAFQMLAGTRSALLRPDTLRGSRRKIDSPDDQVEIMARQGFWVTLGCQIGPSKRHRGFGFRIHDDHVGKQSHIGRKRFGIACVKHRHVHP